MEPTRRCRPPESRICWEKKQCGPHSDKRHLSLAALDTVAKHFAASRNDLIERSIQRLLPIFEKERIRQQQCTEALSRIASHFDQGKELVGDVKAMVGEDDALYQSLVSVMETYEKVVDDMQNRVDKGKRISEFPLDALRRDKPQR
jgi:hypothetical protein